jgi:hypothetical protein
MPSGQVGATPEGVEVPKCVVDPSCLETIAQQQPGNRAVVPTGADPKWRFFWRLGPRPRQTKFSELNAEPVIPHGKSKLTGSHLIACRWPLMVSSLLFMGTNLPLNSFHGESRQWP